ncbi:anaphase-promoting complex subunit 1-like [Tropilaelaps mercedesae]|uniref:Anaphase-promoting complex subunit 1-like n=1 Tax=Tropilaelaps mercedesae TaxID=418985 RepID=A0A1V9XPJ3_9ACAR|nr:anaphase-promoting complex subunit 1-like [Tropilaelaps mercedesae]
MLSCAAGPRAAICLGQAALKNHPGPLRTDDSADLHSHDLLSLHQTSSSNNNNNQKHDNNVDLLCSSSSKSAGSTRTTVYRRYRSTPDGEPIQEELCLQGNVLVVTELKANAQRTLKTLTLPEGRNEVFWAKYCTNDIKSRSVLKVNLEQTAIPFKRIDCISALNSRSKLLHTFSSDGKDFVTHIPFDVQHIWPTDKGVVLERVASRDSKSPKIFSLFHPLDELAPVEIVYTPQRRVIAHDGISMCFSSESSEYVVIYNSRELVHSVCRLRLASSAELHGGLKIKDTLSLHRVNSPAFFSSTPVVSPANHSTPVPSYPLRSRLTDTPKSRSNQSPGLMRVQQKSTPLRSTPIRTPVRSGSNNSHLSVSTHNPDLLSSTFSMPGFNRSSMSSSMLSRLNANITVISEPVLSDLTLDVIFIDKLVVPNPTEKVRMVGDLLGNQYIVLLLASMKKLRLFKLSSGNFVAAGEITAYDFEYMESLKMMLVMASAEGHLFFYSGTTQLCAVNNPLMSYTHPIQTRRSRGSSSSDLLRSPANMAYQFKSAGANVVYIQDVREDKEYMLTLPLANCCETVENCIEGLVQLLEPEMVLLIKSKWFLTKNSIECTSPAKELQAFMSMLFQLVGFEVEETSLLKHKRQRTESDDEEDWQFLLNFNSLRVGTPSFKFNNILSPLCYHVLFALHIVYEDLKVNSVLGDHCRVMAEYLCRLASSLALDSYRDYYLRDFPTMKNIKALKQPERGLRDIRMPDFFEADPPSLMKYILGALAGNSAGKVFPCLAGVTTNIQWAIQVFGSLIVGGEMAYKHLPSIRVWKSSSANLVETLSSSDVAKLNVRLGYRFMFSNLIQKLTERSTHDFSKELYSLLGRRDLGKQVKLHRSAQAKSGHSFVSLPTDGTKGREGFENLFHAMLALRFGEDYRIKEVCSMFATSTPVTINIQQGADMSDHDFAEEQERHLYSLCIRTLALPLGRGMLTLDSIHPIISEPIAIPHCDLTGRVPPKNTVIDMKNIETPPNMTQWPLFHNGVAAGLRVARNAKNVTSAWIALNETYQEINADTNSGNSGNTNGGGVLEFGGFMLGLGLAGHLATLNPVFICELLRKRNAIMSAGVLLGLGASKKATMSQEATNLIAIHIDALLPSTSTELDVSAECRVAAISALGLLYLGSGHQHMCDVLLSEIGRPPGPEMEHCVDRESHSLSAGIALGMVMLCRGAASSQVMQSKLSNTLYNYMVGGPVQGDANKNHRSPSYQIREGDHINISVTSPGATLALGFIYHATENQNIASLMSVPETQYLLDTVQPDYLLLRTLSKGLILWSQVTPSKDWVESHLTQFIKENAFKRPSESIPLDTVDYEGATQAYCNTLAGACFALGLKFAGSGNRGAFKTLMHYTMMFYDIQKQPAAEQAGKNTMETSLLVCLLASSLVMAGTGDLDVLRLCRVLRKRIGQSTNNIFYGSHMMIHMAIGFLFLGGGSLTLSNKPEAIAALVCALYPKFPTHFSDNRYHLQALRHLYVLAVEPRLLVCHDVVSNKLVKSKIKVSLKGRSEPEEMLAPCNLPPLEYVDSVTVDDERYWKVRFCEKNLHLLREALQNRSFVYVKQKAGCLSYVEDPQGYRTTLAQCHIKEALRGRNVESRLQHLESFSNTPMVTKFVENLLSPGASRDQVQERLCTIVMECAAGEQMELLPILTDLMSLRLEHDCTFNLQQFKMIAEFLAYSSEKQISICGENVVRELIAEVELQLGSPGGGIASAAYEVWYGRRPEQVPRGLPALFLQLKGSEMSLSAIVKLYNSLADC